MSTHAGNALEEPASVPVALPEPESSAEPVAAVMTATVAGTTLPSWSEIGRSFVLRLTSRRFWAFIAGLAAVIVTTMQTSPDPRFTLLAVVGAVAAYIAGESYTDGRRAP